MKQKKFAKAFVRQVANDAGLLTAVIGSTDAIDRYGESIDQSSWNLKHFKKNPVILWAHNLTMGEDRPPIGKATKVKVLDNKLTFDIQFDMGDPFAADIFRKYNEGFLSAFSVGFIPHKIQRSDSNDQPPILMDNELLELSAVPVPANPEALNALRTLSFKTKSWDKMMKEVDAEEKGEDEDEKPAEETSSVDDNGAPEDGATPTEPITDVDSAASTEGEDESGDNSAPKTPSVGDGTQKMARVLRQATKMLQGALAEYNASTRK